MPRASCCPACASSEKTVFRCPASPSYFGMGLALGMLTGAVGAVVLSRRHASVPEPAGLRIWRGELAKTRGAVAAGILSARIQSRYDDLKAARPRFDSSALRHHMENNILPGLALYQVLCEENEDREAVFTELDRLQEASLLASAMGFQTRLLGLFPDPFSVFRFYMNRTLTKQFPKEGWDFRWVENTPDAIAFDYTSCFYMDVLSTYGFPELTAHFCHLDDVLMAQFPYFAWKRTRTLGRGDAVCDFRYERMV